MIRAAYDVSAAVSFPGHPPPETGVGRVIREVVVRIARERDLEVSAVGCFGGDWNPVSTSLCAESWAAKVVPKPIRSTRAFRSRTGLSRLLGSLQIRWEAARKSRGERAKHPAVDPWLLRLFRRILRWDSFPSVLDVDLFCATFRPPPTELSPNVLRAHIIYDVIPARLPEECGPVACGMLQAVLASIDPARDVVIAISEFTKRDFCSLTGFPLVRAFVAPLAANAAFRPCREMVEIERVRRQYSVGAAPYFLSVANPQPRKNLARTVRAFFSAVKALPEWDGNLVLAGNDKLGWGGGEVEQAISEEPNLAGRVCRIGAVAESDLPVLYSGCECFIFPSTYEGFGLPVLEAMQCGAPVITSNTTSLVEVAGEAALLVNPVSEREIAQAIVEMARLPGVRRQCASAGLLRAAEFSWEKTAGSVAAAFRFAVSTSSAH